MDEKHELEDKYDPSNDPITPQEESLFQAAEWLARYIREVRRDNINRYFRQTSLVSECPNIERYFPGFTNALKNGIGSNDLDDTINWENDSRTNVAERIWCLVNLVWMITMAEESQRTDTTISPVTKWLNVLNTVGPLRIGNMARKFANRQLQKDLQSISKNRRTLMTKFEKVKPHEASEDVTKNILSFASRGVAYKEKSSSYIKTIEKELMQTLEPMIRNGLSFDQFHRDRNSVTYGRYQHIRSLLDSSQQNEFDRRFEEFFRSILQKIGEELIQGVQYLTPDMDFDEFEAFHGPTWERIRNSFSVSDEHMNMTHTNYMRFRKVKEIRQLVKDVFDRSQKNMLDRINSLIPNILWEHRYTFSEFENAVDRYEELEGRWGDVDELAMSDSLIDAVTYYLRIRHQRNVRSTVERMFHDHRQKLMPEIDEEYARYMRKK